MSTPRSEQTVPPVEAAPGRFWLSPDFARLWIGQTISQVGSQVSEIALPLLAILALNAGALQLGLLLSISKLPYFLFTLVAGVWIDRLQRRGVLILCDIGRGVALLLVPIAAGLHVLSFPLLLTVSFVHASLSVFFTVAYQAYLPSLVGRNLVVSGNAKLETSNSAAQIVGPGLGGVLVQSITAPLAVLADSISFFVSALLLIAIRWREPRLAAAGQGSSPRTLLRDIWSGVLLVWRHPVLRAIGIAAGVFNLFFTGFQATYILFMSHALHLTPAEIGVVLAAFGPGLLLGAISSRALSRRLRLGRAVAAGALISDLAVLAIPGIHGPPQIEVPMLVLSNLAIGFGITVYNVAIVSVRQLITPRSLQGRVNATVRFFGLGLAPIGGLLGGVLVQAIGLRYGLVLLGAGLLGGFVVVITTPLFTLTSEGVQSWVVPEPESIGGV